ncbi:MAG: hypothetical protein AAF620_19325 [Bacteroidota bacterium]
MRFYCLEDFKLGFTKLSKKNSYSDLESLTVDFVNGDSDFLKIGVNLNRNNEQPYVKKRLKGRSGYRIYYYFLIMGDQIFMLYIHPKTGVLGSTNLEEKYRADLLKRIKDIIVNKKWEKLYEVFADDDKISFKKPAKITIPSQK